MKRIRLGTALLVVVIAALVLALVAQQRRAAMREAQWCGKLNRMQYRAEIERHHALLVEANAKQQFAKFQAEIKRLKSAAGQPAHRKKGD